MKKGIDVGKDIGSRLLGHGNPFLVAGSCRRDQFQYGKYSLHPTGITQRRELASLDGVARSDPIH
jgi:hypothetical protein